MSKNINPKKSESWVFSIRHPSDAKKMGTGFVCHKTKTHYYLITCAHVLKEVTDQGLVNKKPIEIVCRGDQDVFDFALLRVQGNETGVSPSSINTSNTDWENAMFKVVGSYPESKIYRQRELSGKFNTRTIVSHHDEPSRYVVKQDCYLSKKKKELKKIRAGYSGSPVWVEGQGVVGILTHSNLDDVADVLLFCNWPRFRELFVDGTYDLEVTDQVLDNIQFQAVEESFEKEGEYLISPLKAWITHDINRQDQLDRLERKKHHEKKIHFARFEARHDDHGFGLAVKIGVHMSIARPIGEIEDWLKILSLVGSGKDAVWLSLLKKTGNKDASDWISSANLNRAEVLVYYIRIDQSHLGSLSSLIKASIECVSRELKDLSLDKNVYFLFSHEPVIKSKWRRFLPSAKKVLEIPGCHDLGSLEAINQSDWSTWYTGLQHDGEHCHLVEHSSLMKLNDLVGEKFSEQQTIKLNLLMTLIDKHLRLSNAPSPLVQ